MTDSVTNKWQVLGMWKFFLALGLPLVLSPMLFSGNEVPRAAFVLILMSVFWLTEAVPLPVTALLPIALYPLMGIKDTESLTMLYTTDSLMIFFGGLLVAIAFEFSNLHKRLALRVLLFTGASISMLLFGMMMTTMAFSMLMFNASATAMMVPIIHAVLEQLNASLVSYLNEDSNNELETGPKARVRRLSHLDQFNNEYGAIARRFSLVNNNAKKVRETIKEMKIMFFLAVGFSSNIGGTGVLTGTGSNLVALEFLGNLDSKNHGPHAELTYANWMMFNVLPMIINVFVGWIYLQIAFIGVPNKYKFWKGKDEQTEPNSIFTPSVEIRIGEMLRKTYDEMGSLTCHELLVLILSLFAICTWILHDPKFIPGWSVWLNTGTKVSISSTGLLAGVLFFIVPRNYEFYKAFLDGDFTGIKALPLLEFEYAQKRFPWGIILLFGGGFALSSGATKSGLAIEIGQALGALKTFPPSLILLFCMFIIALCTNVASNSATASIVVPVLLELSKELNIHPFYLTIPAVTVCSYAFLLPVGTPANALIFAAGEMKISTMIKNGLFMNCACIVVLWVSTIFIGDLIFHFSEYSYIP